jgi:signal transduction histidine kinase
MRVQPGSTHYLPGGQDPRPQAPARETRGPGRWMLLARGTWLTLVVLTLAICFASLPLYLAQLQTPCAPTACHYQQLTPAQAEMLAQIGWSLGEYAAITLTLLLVTIGVCLVVSTLIIWRRPDDRMALLVALLLVTFGPINVTANAPEMSPWLVPDQGVTLLTNALFVLVFSLFPSGRFVPPWMRWNLVGWLAVLVLPHFLLSVPFPLGISVVQLGWLLFLVELVLMALVQVYRYRQVSGPLERQQTKWVVFGLAWPTLVSVLASALALLLPVAVEHQALVLLAYNEASFLLVLAFPFSFGVAILRYRLWEIDTLINRTLVYGLLSALVVSLYVLVVNLLSTLVRTGTDGLFALLATGLIAVLFQPLRLRLQRLVNRWMYGERDDPSAVLSRLGRRLEATLEPEAVLPTIVETVAQALRLPYAALAVKQGEAFITAASSGRPQSEPLMLPLVYQRETIGQLHLAPRAPGEAFTPADHRLLADLAHQAGIAVHAVQLTAALQHSRERLVATREEERRRLRRDLHDGLGPTLASMTLKLDAARNLLTQQPAAVDPLLVEVKAQLQTTIIDIRRLVYDLRPPALDELGLVSALQEQAMQYHRLNGVQVVIEAPPQLPPLPAAVEVAAYRIVLEALTNVARHAQAHTCCVRLALAEGLTIEVSDDGQGLPSEQHVGVGLASMRERAAELGGTCLITTGATGGTHVLVRLPLAKE